MRIPAVSITRWSVDANGNVYRPDGYVGIGTTTPHAALTVDGVISLRKTTAPEQATGYGALYIGDDDQLHMVNELGVEVPIAGGSTTEAEHYRQHSDAIQTIVKSLDGYSTGGVTAAQGADGYLAFFIGSESIAGDNDLFWDRADNMLRVGTIEIGRGTGNNSERFGSGSVAAGEDSFAAGPLAQVSGYRSTALGYFARAPSYNSVAVGSSARAWLQYSVSVGDNSYADSDAVAVGRSATASGPSSTVLGRNSQATQNGAVAIGTNSGAKASYAIGIGYSAKGDGNQGIGIGYSANSAGQYAVALGGSTVATGSNSIVLGRGANSYRDYDGQWGSSTYPIDFCMYGQMGVGTNFPHERLTVNGIISLQEQDNYDRQHDGYLSLFAKTDAHLYYRTAGGEEHVVVTSSDGYLSNPLPEFVALGGTTGEFPALKRSDDRIEIRTADDGYGQLQTGGMIYNYTQVSDATYTTTATDYYVGCQRTADGACTITLATSSMIPGRTVVVLDEGQNAGSNNITIDTEGSELINNATSTTISSNGGSLTIVCNGVNWYTL